MNIFINDQDEGAQRAFSWFANDTELGGVLIHHAIQRDLNRLKKWADRNLIMFKEGESKVLGRNNYRHNYMLGATQLKKHLIWKATWGPD